MWELRAGYLTYLFSYVSSAFLYLLEAKIQPIDLSFLARKFSRKFVKIPLVNPLLKPVSCVPPPRGTPPDRGVACCGAAAEEAPPVAEPEDGDAEAPPLEPPPRPTGSTGLQITGTSS